MNVLFFPPKTGKSFGGEKSGIFVGSLYIYIYIYIYGIRVFCFFVLHFDFQVCFHHATNNPREKTNNDSHHFPQIAPHSKNYLLPCVLFPQDWGKSLEEGKVVVWFFFLLNQSYCCLFVCFLVLVLVFDFQVCVFCIMPQRMQQQQQQTKQ